MEPDSAESNSYGKGFIKGYYKGYTKGYGRDHGKSNDKSNDKSDTRGRIKGYVKGDGKGYIKGYFKPPPGLSLNQTAIAFGDSIVVADDNKESYSSSHSSAIASENKNNTCAEHIHCLRTKVNEQQKKIEQLEREKKASVEVHQMMRFLLSEYQIKERDLAFKNRHSPQETERESEEKVRSIRQAALQKFKTNDQKNKEQQNNDPEFMSKLSSRMNLPFGLGWV